MCTVYTKTSLEKIKPFQGKIVIYFNKKCTVTPTKIIPKKRSEVLKAFLFIFSS
tara:strand:- start:4908 stop:5069 length:162 start_codon:yes stop_codon:yes gene_type:complete